VGAARRRGQDEAWNVREAREILKAMMHDEAAEARRRRGAAPTRGDDGRSVASRSRG
jgi:hypothetical protein